MDTNTLKAEILTCALMDTPDNGWNMAAIRTAAVALGQDARMADALFAGGIRGVNDYISTYFDDLALSQLGMAPADMRVHDKIERAVMTRLDLMAPYKDGLRIAMTRPGVRALWRSADAIWIWAGDTSDDYNHYTKRALLSGVMGSTLLYWFGDKSPGHRASMAFLQRRISNVLGVGRMMGMAKSFLSKKAAVFVLAAIIGITPLPAKAGSQSLLDIYQGYAGDTLTDMTKAHRNVRELGEWASSIVADSLQFKAGQGRQKLGAVRPYFSEEGFKSYMQFLGTTSFADALRADTLNLTTIVNNAPLLVGQSSAVRHAWVFEMPVIMTQAGATAVRPITLRIQIGRAANAPAPHHVFIEKWSIFE